jgi:hypothetical protein
MRFFLGQIPVVHRTVNPLRRASRFIAGIAAGLYEVFTTTAFERRHRARLRKLRASSLRLHPSHSLNADSD